jgi:ribonucleotide monophosphatase NagD (HAD superfamily)
MIGDRLDTDSLGGINAKMRTIMVETGVSTRAEAEQGTITPDIIYPDLVTLLAAYRAVLQ